MVQLIAIKQESQTRLVRDLGEFTVSSGAIRFSDPCYDNTTWCKGSMPAVNGQWQARVGLFRDSGDEVALTNRINRFKYLLSYHKKFKNQNERKLWSTFGLIVGEANDSRNGWQKISRLYELIQAGNKNKDILKSLADEAVAFFEPLYTNQKELYWEKDIWLLLELAGAFQLHHEHLGFDESMFSMAYSKLQEKLKNNEISQIEMDKKVANYGHCLTQNLEKALASSQKIYDSGQPHRVQFLHVKHQSLPDFSELSQSLWLYNDKFDVGVDSGQAGFFDESWYANYGDEKNNGGKRGSEWEKTYNFLGELSLGKFEYDETGKRKEYNYAGAFEFGCNGLTAHGDGSAPLYYRTNEANEVIEAIYAYDFFDEESEELENE